MTEADLELSDGRTLHVYDTGADDGGGRLAVFWHHGTPNIGAPPEPLFAAAAQLGIRWVSYDRPGYGGPAVEAGPGGLIDDDLAYVVPWGVDPARVIAPVVLLHGGRDRVVPSSHSEWLARRRPSAELRLCPDDGHISVLNSGAAAVGWLREHAGRG